MEAAQAHHFLTAALRSWTDAPEMERRESQTAALQSKRVIFFNLIKWAVLFWLQSCLFEFIWVYLYCWHTMQEVRAKLLFFFLLLPFYFLFWQTICAWGENLILSGPRYCFVKGFFFNKTCFKEHQQSFIKLHSALIHFILSQRDKINSHFKETWKSKVLLNAHNCLALTLKERFIHQFQEWKSSL